MNWEQLRPLFEKKSTFERGVQSATSEVASHAGSNMDEDLWVLVKRCHTLLKARYTGIPFWRLGLRLYQACQGLQMDNTQGTCLKQYIQEAKEFLNEEDKDTTGNLVDPQQTVEESPAVALQRALLERFNSQVRSRPSHLSDAGLILEDDSATHGPQQFASLLAPLLLGAASGSDADALLLQQLAGGGGDPAALLRQLQQELGISPPVQDGDDEMQEAADAAGSSTQRADAATQAGGASTAGAGAASDGNGADHGGAQQQQEQEQEGMDTDTHASQAARHMQGDAPTQGEPSSSSAADAPHSLAPATVAAPAAGEATGMATSPSSAPSTPDPHAADAAGTPDAARAAQGGTASDAARGTSGSDTTAGSGGSSGGSDTAGSSGSSDTAGSSGGSGSGLTPRVRRLRQVTAAAAQHSALQASILEGIQAVYSGIEAVARGTQAVEAELDGLLMAMREGGGQPAQPSGPPPASKKLVASLPRLPVTPALLEQWGADSCCPVCTEQLVQGDVVMQLPCRHHFHPDCLQPWFNQHNSCPICRHELPTDDAAYEARKEREAQEAEDRMGAANALSHNEFMYI